jgi:IAA-amino acid hydrolase
MIGTVRSRTTEGLHYLQQRVREIATHIASANRCEAEVSFPGNDYPPTVNDAECWNEAKSIAASMLGEESVIEHSPVMGGEDFAFYGPHARSVFVMLGIRNEAVGSTFALHHPKFKMDEDALPIGSALHAAYALRYCGGGD